MDAIGLAVIRATGELVILSEINGDSVKAARLVPCIIPKDDLDFFTGPTSLVDKMEPEPL